MSVQMGPTSSTVGSECQVPHTGSKLFHTAFVNSLRRGFMLFKTVIYRCNSASPKLVPAVATMDSDQI